MTTSESIHELAAALAKAQAAMKNATLNRVNPHFKSKYADLAGIRDAVMPVLAAHGLSVVQAIGAGAVQTRLLHSSGQWIESECPIPPVQDMQKLGSAITYARRYSLSAIACIAADEDDDGNEAATVPLVPFDEAGYQAWLALLEQSAIEGGFDSLTADAKAGKPEYQDRLRADKATWAKLKGKTGAA